MAVNPGRSKVLIVGAGIGGIATAAHLARNGYEVTVLEKNEKSGGRCGQMTVDGYTFDTGATLFMMPDLYNEAFAALGERMEDHLELRRIDPTYHLYFQDNTQLQLTSDLHEMQTRWRPSSRAVSGGCCAICRKERKITDSPCPMWSIRISTACLSLSILA